MCTMTARDELEREIAKRLLAHGWPHLSTMEPDDSDVSLARRIVDLVRRAVVEECAEVCMKYKLLMQKGTTSEEQWEACGADQCETDIRALVPPTERDEP